METVVNNFKCIVTDMDGTLLNTESKVSRENANALRQAVGRGILVVIATGKTRAAAINLLKEVDGVASKSSPGVYAHGLLVYGRNGEEIFSKNLTSEFCTKAFRYSKEHGVPLVAFCHDRCLTLFDHPLVDALHTVYHEPKAEIISSIHSLVSSAKIQKLVFLDTAEGVAKNLRAHWSEEARDQANVVHALPDMLEIVPVGTSKGMGVQILLDHLGISAQEVMALGDGENDVEMLQLTSLGVAMSNGCEEAKAAADVIGYGNDEDGVARAIRQFAF